MNSDLVERVKLFVAHQRGVKVSRLTLQTTLQDDLGADGADGWELIEEFGRQFEVDISAFQPRKHFGPEGCGCIFLCLFFPWLLGEPDDILRDYVPISICDLVEAAKAKRWLK